MSTPHATRADARAQESQLRSRQQFLAARLKAQLLASGEPRLTALAGRADLLVALSPDLAGCLDAPSRSELLELREIERSLRNLESAGQGRCRQCGGQIEPERLALHPDADWCQVCKTAFEVRRGIATATNTGRR